MLALAGSEALPMMSESKDQPAPDFTLKTLAGDEVELSKLRGKVVIVNFWATWCGPCRAEIPHLNALYDKYAAKGLEIVGVSLDRTGEAGVRAFVEKNGMRYIVAMGNSDVVVKYGGVSAIPTTFIIDREGKVRGRWEGFRDESAMVAAILPLLDEKSQEKESTSP
jgi:peroxiredoxin